MKRNSYLVTAMRVFVLLALVAGLGFLPRGQTTVQAAGNWHVAGSFQGWDPASMLMFDDGTHGDLWPNDGVYSLSVTIAAAGRYEWKVTNGTWSVSYPISNSWFYTSVDGQEVTFTFDSNHHVIDAGPKFYPITNIVNVLGDTLPTTYTVVGDMQGWDPNNPATEMTDMGHGIYRLAYVIPDAAHYNFKVVANHSWAEQFTWDGRATDGNTFYFDTTVPNQLTIFLLDTNTGRIYAAPNGAGSGTYCAAGSFQGWDPGANPLFDDGTHGDLLGGDGVYSLDVAIASAGHYEWKVTNCTWGATWPSQNAWLNTTSDGQTVKLTFDTNNHATDVGVDLIPAVNIPNAWDSLPATFNAVGDYNGWNNADPALTLTNLDKGLAKLATTAIPIGSYTYQKLTATSTWWSIGNEGRVVDAGAENPLHVVSDANPTLFLLDRYNGRWAYYASPVTHASHDNDVWWNELYHDSRDTLYRNPGGPVTTGTSVTLRIRSAMGDLTAAKVRLYNDRTNTERLVSMNLVLSQDPYDYWETTLDVGPDPTVYWYRFLVIDGTKTVYYEDDDARTGGLGAPRDSSADNSWQLTVYDPAYVTPDWMKNAVVYQIFPDRFFDANPANNKPAGSFFYNESGTIVRSNTTNWNTAVCDPRINGNACSGSYSKNFYGGDLQGVTAKLDYLKDLGVTVLYLNPIFSSPSNHGYDTSDYMTINPSLGTQADFEALISGAHARGMKVVLDGVFNHTSSDSIYFDRYGRYSSVGACESTTSPYRLWYTFTGTGPCAGGTNYNSWWGYDSLPILRSSDAAVRNFIYGNGTASVAPYWMQWADGWRLDVGGDVDPGVNGDAANTYWEEFRAAVRAVKPDAYIAGEEWGNASSWLLGQEWDAVMNYQFSSAVLSFWRDTTFTDNDHNVGSSAGALTPLSPEQLNERLLNLMERYPKPALEAMLNLLDSHDTNRALFLLDENSNSGDASIYQNPAYDWSPAIAKLKGVAILQMTLPGAPTIYYGDEVGLVGPLGQDSSNWQDDPYNRQPYPWLSASGTPFYTFLQSQANQDALRNYYKLLTSARNSHAALRTGDFRTLAVNNANKLYAYGRKLGTDAAVVVLNRAGAAQDVSLNVGGYLPEGAAFQDALSGASFTVSGGTLDVTGVPAQSGMVLVASAALPEAPAAVTDLAVTAEDNGTVDLAWTAVPGATSYDVFRSQLSGGGYELIGSTASPTYHDSGLTNASMYYYVVKSVNSATGLTSGYSNEAAGMPHLLMTWANLQWPYMTTTTISAVTPTEMLYGQVGIPGVTHSLTPIPSLIAQVGYGEIGQAPNTWTHWVNAAYNWFGGTADRDEYMAQLFPEAVGEFRMAYRFSTTGGRSWLYGGVYGAFDGTSCYDFLLRETCGVLTVLPGADITPPAAPANLHVTDWGAAFINLAWDANTEPDLYAYDLYRSDGGPLVKIARLMPDTLTYADTEVVSGTTYTYQLKAADTSFNFSDFSAPVTKTAEPKMVNVTFNVTVPAFTPADSTIYIVGDQAQIGNWNPGAVPMTKVDATHWTFTTTFLDGASIQYKFTRGTWDMVEKEADGNTEIANRTLLAAYGADGTQTVNLTVANWRDPIVTAISPADGSTVAAYTPVTVTWSQAVVEPYQVQVVGADASVMSGSFSYNAGSNTVTFTPAAPYKPSMTYTVTVSGQQDLGGDFQQGTKTFSFNTRQGMTGKVLDGYGAPVEGVKMTLNYTLQTAYTDADGNYYFSDVNPGVYVVRASKTGWTLSPLSRTVVVGSSTLSSVNFTAYKNNVVYLLTPANGSRVIYRSLTAVRFDWRDVPGAARYTLHVWNDSTAPYQLNRTVTLSQAALLLPLKNRTTYKWEVVAYNRLGVEIARSPVWTFRVEPW